MVFIQEQFEVVVNNFCENKHYIDEKSAVSKYGNTAKEELNTSVHHF